MDMLFGLFGNKKKKNKNTRTMLIQSFNSTTKMLMWFFSINAALWIWCSYALAWAGRVEIAESLSSNVCTVCIGQLVAYFVSKTVENVFKYNEIGGASINPASFMNPGKFTNSFSNTSSSQYEDSSDIKRTNKTTTTNTTVKKEESLNVSQSFN